MRLPNKSAAVYNEAGPTDPFDSDTPHEISKSAFSLARSLGIKDGDVVEIIAPHE